MKRLLPEFRLAAFIIAAAIALLFSSLFCLCLSGCGEMTKATKSTETKYDSSYVSNLEREVQTWKISATEYERQIKEMEQLSFTSDKECPPQVERLIKVVEEKCPANIVDSVKQLVASLYIRIKYLADGSYDIQGALSSAKILKQKLEKEKLYMRDSIRQLTSEVERLRGTVSKKEEVKTVDKHRAGLFPRWAAIFFGLLITALIIYYFYIQKKKNK